MWQCVLLADKATNILNSTNLIHHSMSRITSVLEKVNFSKGQGHRQCSLTIITLLLLTNILPLSE